MIKKMTRFIKAIIYILGAVALLCVAIMFVCNRVVVHNSKGKCYDDVEQIPTRTVGVLLGTTPQTRVGGRKFFKYRIEAAEDLYEKGKVHCLLISGDENSLNGVNEPQCNIARVPRVRPDLGKAS